MGNFTNTKRNNMINSLIEGYKKRLDNPYYVNMHNPTIGTYYSTNMNHTTLAEGSKMSYADIGTESPIRFNKIEDFYMYGLDKLLVQLDNGEWGLESEAVETDAIILPNTVIPVPNDYFAITYLKKQVLFRVTKSTPDTLDNGANFYQISMKVDQLDLTKIESNIQDSFHMIVDNVGSQLNTIVRSDEFNFMEFIEETTDKLKIFYKKLFYFPRVDSFIWCKGNYNFYDPYMIEFLIRNDILKSSDDYLFITQQSSLPRTFALDYDRSFFRAIENCKFKDGITYTSTATLIEDPLSILTSRIEQYFMIDYAPSINIYLEIIENIDSDLIDKIKNKQLYENDYKNIIIKYFIHEPINKQDIQLIDDIDFVQSKELFYYIPFLIFILEKQELELLKKEK